MTVIKRPQLDRSVLLKVQQQNRGTGWQLIPTDKKTQLPEIKQPVAFAKVPDPQVKQGLVAPANIN